MTGDDQISPPVNDMPKCWQDDKRMNVLFSPFRKRELNPIDYDSKMKFWSNLMVQWCLENNKCIVTLATFKNAFKRKGRTPSCLITVIEELLRNGDIKNKYEFLSTTVADSTWSGWVINSVKSPFLWSFSKLKDALAEVDPDEVQYVHIGCIKSLGETLLVNAEKVPGKELYTIDEIQKLIGPKECSSEMAEVIVHWLKLEHKCCTIKCGNDELIKIAISPASLKITERDLAQFKLLKSREVLVKGLTALEEEKEKALKDAKEHLSKGLKTAAKSSLRKKKALEECITKRISTLDNLDVLFARIRDAVSDAEVFDSYKMGVSALKSTFKEAGLTEDTALDTINDLQEVNEMQDEIKKALSDPVQANSETESELEEELSAILANVELNDNLNLPDVPSTLSPAKSITKHNKEEPIKFAIAD